MATVPQTTCDHAAGTSHSDVAGELTNMARRRSIWHGAHNENVD
jgi:hypothetical protein